MNRKVFLSILAMDSYQRGYAFGIDNVGGNKIGTATIGQTSSTKKDSTEVAVGFFAQSYTWGSDTVISYRGTDVDFANGGSFVDGEFIKDAANGWNTFLQLPFTSEAPFLSLQNLGVARQFILAEAFFKAVVPGAEFNDGVTYNNVTVTGHSLGGALAGFVDARADVNSYLVDPIPYGVTSWISAIQDAWDATIEYFEIDSLLDFAPLFIAGYSGPLLTFQAVFAANLTARAPQLAGIDGVYLEGEIASQILSLQPTIGAGALVAGGATSALSAVLPFGFNGIAATVGGLLTLLGFSQVVSGIANNIVEDTSGLDEQENYGVLDYLPDGLLTKFSRSVSLHSIGLLPTLLYGEYQWAGENNHAAEGGPVSSTGLWRQTAKYWGYGSYDKDIANALGIFGGDQGDKATGLTSAEEQMSRMVAYSAINEGTLVFGITVTVH